MGPFCWPVCQVPNNLYSLKSQWGGGEGEGDLSKIQQAGGIKPQIFILICHFTLYVDVKRLPPYWATEQLFASGCDCKKFSSGNIFSRFSEVGFSMKSYAIFSLSCKAKTYVFQQVNFMVRIIF